MIRFFLPKSFKGADPVPQKEITAIDIKAEQARQKAAKEQAKPNGDESDK